MRENCLPTILKHARNCEQQNIRSCSWKSTFGNHEGNDVALFALMSYTWNLQWMLSSQSRLHLNLTLTIVSWSNGQRSGKRHLNVGQHNGEVKTLTTVDEFGPWTTWAYKRRTNVRLHYYSSVHTCLCL